MLRRPLVGPRLHTPEPPSVPEFELVDVTRLLMVLDTGLPLQFDLEKRDNHTFEDPDMDAYLVVRLGERVIRIARHRILYYETLPAQVKRFRQPLTADQFAALQKQ